MPADLTEVDGDVSMAYAVEYGHPWHRMGKQMERKMDIDEALELIGVGDELVYPATPYTINDDAVFESKQGTAILLKDLEQIPNTISVKSSKFGSISTAGAGYEITQRREVLELAYEVVGLSRGDARIDTIGNLGERADTFFAYIRVPDLVIDPGGVADTIERGLFVATSFNGSMANTIGNSDIRPVCRNTVSMALGRLQQGIRAKHTRNSEERLREAAVALEYAGAVEAEKIKRAEKMLKVSEADALKVIRQHFWDTTKEGTPESTKSRRNNEFNEMVELLRREGNTNTRLLGDNGWAVFQAFIEWQDHHRRVRGFDMEKDVKRAQAAVLPGRVVNDKIKASELILALGA